MVEVNRGSERVYRRSGREAMVILSIQRPSINVAANATRPTMLTLSKELKRADNMLERSLQWNKIVSEENNGAKEFLQASNNYIVLKVSYWGGSRMKCRGLLGWLESRLVNVSKPPPQYFNCIKPILLRSYSFGYQMIRRRRLRSVYGLVVSQLPSAHRMTTRHDPISTPSTLFPSPHPPPCQT
jgi:hypothetical protein